MRKRGQKQAPTKMLYAQTDLADCSGDSPPFPYHLPLIEQTSDALVVLNHTFQICDVNDAATHALGLTSTQARGATCKELLRCQNLNRIQLCGTSSCPLTRALGQGKALPHEELIIGPDETSSCEVSASITPLYHVNQQYAVFSARDMSMVKVANRVRSNFVSMVSHELRTPLNSVHGFIDLLLQGHMGEMTEEQKTFLGYAQEGVQQLVSIVEDILFMTRSDLGQFETRLQEVHLRPLVQQVISTLHPQALKADVHLIDALPEQLPVLSVDPRRIRQVLNNLLANSLKFTPPGGTITISSEAAEEGFQRILVSDTGYGIPVVDRQHVFERFYQSNHSQQSRMGGYGLGLSIARLIVEQHGGSIHFETALNKGTTFFFTVPISQTIQALVEHETSPD